MDRDLRVLHVEDSMLDATLLERHLSRSGYRPLSERVETSETMRAALEKGTWDVILCDYSMPTFNAVEALTLLKELGLDIPFIIISGTVGETVAVEAMRVGAHDYLMKDNLVRLAPIIDRELQDVEGRRARRRAEEALKDSETELSALFESMTDVILVLDSDGRYLKIAPTKSASANTPANEWIGKTLHEVFPKEAADRFLACIRSALVEGQTQQIEYSLLIKGREVWFEGRVSRMAQDSVIWIARDITERKRAGEQQTRLTSEIESQRQRLNNIVASVPGVVWETWDEPDRGRQRINFVSGYVETMLGYSVDEWLSTPDFWLSNIHPDDRKETASTAAAGFANGKISPQEYRWMTKDGHATWVESTYAVIKDEQDRPVGLRGVTLDINERKRAQDTLLHSEERYRLLFELNPQPMWLFDLETLFFLEVNEAAIRHYGYSREEFLAMTIKDLRPPGSSPNPLANLSATSPQHEEAVIWKHMKKDGTIIDVEITAHAIKFYGRQAKIVLAFDVTTRRVLEMQLRQSQKMESIGTLAGGIAHDFNNILAAIVGYTELAQAAVDEGSNTHGHLEQVLTGSARARDLVQQILTFSRQKEPERESLQLRQIIDETLKLLRISLPSKIDIRQDISTVTPSVFGDSTQIQQVLMNLCVNAGQAMKESGGTLDIKLTCLEIDSLVTNAHSALKQGSHIRLSVSDTGCGMDRSTQERIFDPFFTTKAPGEGTGLGLAVVDGIVKNHGGAVTVSSLPGVGTTFIVYLPVHAGQEGVVTHNVGAVPRGNGEHILFIDDDQTLVSLAKSTLEHLGYRATVMTNSLEALAAFQSQPRDFDLVITDQAMPHMDGTELARSLLRIWPSLPVIMSTGYRTGMSLEKAKAMGIRELLFKPNTMRTLGEAVSRALSQNRKV